MGDFTGAGAGVAGGKTLGSNGGGGGRADAATWSFEADVGDLTGAGATVGAVVDSGDVEIGGGGITGGAGRVGVTMAMAAATGASGAGVPAGVMDGALVRVGGGS